MDSNEIAVKQSVTLSKEETMFILFFRGGFMCLDNMGFSIYQNALRKES